MTNSRIVLNTDLDLKRFMEQVSNLTDKSEEPVKALVKGTIKIEVRVTQEGVDKPYVLSWWTPSHLIVEQDIGTEFLRALLTVFVEITEYEGNFNAFKVWDTRTSKWRSTYVISPSGRLLDILTGKAEVLTKQLEIVRSTGRLSFERELIFDGDLLIENNLDVVLQAKSSDPYVVHWISNEFGSGWYKKKLQGTGSTDLGSEVSTMLKIGNVRDWVEEGKEIGENKVEGENDE